MTTALAQDGVCLIPLDKSHIPSITPLLNNRRIWINMRDLVPFPYTEADAESFVLSVQDQSPAMTFAIEYEGSFCGVIGLIAKQDVYRESAEVGYWIGEPFWGRGIATRSLLFVTEYGIRQLNLRRIESAVFSSNPASMRVLEKAGYQREGIFKRAVLKDGRIFDEHRFAYIP